jgi:hypothetical protein
MYYNLHMRLSVVSGGLLIGVILTGLSGHGLPQDGVRPGAVDYQSVAGAYAALPRKSSAPTLPKAIVLKEQGRAVALSPGQLGIKIDKQAVAATARHKGLPLGGKLADSGPKPAFFAIYSKPVYIKVNQIALINKLTELAEATKQNPVDASIINQGQTYLISPEAVGRQIDVEQAAVAIKGAALSGKTVVNLPLASLPPAVTEVSLQPRLQQMKDQQAQQAAAARLAAAAKPLTPSSCADNTAGQLILVSISRQHMWACDGTNQAYDSAITSGAYLAGDATPTGTWHIYSKSTNIHLIGPTWDDFVNYWMPFYSAYGFHDSSWQTFPYGDPAYASQGSHGCVHLPLPAMAWLYGWSHVGTTVTITT